MGRGPGVKVRLTAAVLASVGMLLVPLEGPPTVAARSPDCPRAPITINKVRRVMQTMDADAVLTCFGNRLLTFRAYVPAPSTWGDPGVSADEGPVLLPRWITDSGVPLSSGPGAGQIPVSVPPALGRCGFRNDDLATCPFRWYWGRWVTVSAHFDGPVAQTCHFSRNIPSQGYTKRAAVEACRQVLIVLSVGVIKPPETATALVPGPVPADPTLPWLPATAFAIAAGVLTLRRSSRRT
jgi:hypothetical protein